MMGKKITNVSEGWITDRLPRDAGYYEVTLDAPLLGRVTDREFWDGDRWLAIDECELVIAWKPLPAPYEGEETLLDLEDL